MNSHPAGHPPTGQASSLASASQCHGQAAICNRGQTLLGASVASSPWRCCACPGERSAGAAGQQAPRAGLHCCVPTTTTGAARYVVFPRCQSQCKERHRGAEAVHVQELLRRQSTKHKRINIFRPILIHSDVTLDLKN